MPLDRPEIARAFDRLYAGNDELAKAYREGKEARAELIGNLARETKEADNGAPPPNSFPGQAARLGRLIAGDARIRLAFASLGGWDTHVNEGDSKGQLANHLRPLGDGLALFAKGLAQRWNDTVVIVLSEFGRTVRENGDGGTDHGHGNVIWVLGGGVRGGRVYGDWPGLETTQLYQGRDLGNHDRLPRRGRRDPRAPPEARRPAARADLSRPPGIPRRSGGDARRLNPVSCSSRRRSGRRPARSDRDRPGRRVSATVLNPQRMEAVSAVVTPTKTSNFIALGVE